MKRDCGKYGPGDVGNRNNDYERNCQRSMEPEFDKLTKKDHAQKSERERHGVTDSQSNRGI